MSDRVRGRNPEIDNFTDQELLAELFFRNGIRRALPFRELHGHWDIVTVSIGNDDVADIMLPRESSNVLMGCDLGPKDTQEWVKFPDGLLGGDSHEA